MRPRWNKIISDLLSHKVRSLLVIASIAVGLFAIGMITTSYVILSEDIRTGYTQINPPNILIRSTFFDDELLTNIRSIAGVSGAQGAWNTSLQIRNAADEWKPVSIKAQDFSTATEAPIGTPILLEGTWPPEDKEIVLDINRLSETGAGLGDEVEIKLPSGIIRRLPVVGIVRDQTLGADDTTGGYFLADLQGYVTEATLPWLEQPESFNTLYVTVENEPASRAGLRPLTDQIVKKFDQNGYPVRSTLQRLSYEHPNLPYVDAMAAVIYALGFLVVFLSGFLITNTFSALLNQQVQQIGVMKTFGASRRQIILMFMVLILVFSLIALVISIPLSHQAAYALLRYLAVKINFELSSFYQVPASIIFQILIALVVPQLAGIFPILQGTRISVREALSGSSTSPMESKGLIYRTLAKFRRLSRPLRISLRNTFRRRGRLALTLITLTLGGATFIATFNVRSSLESYVDRLGRYFLADVNVTLNQTYRIDRVRRDLAAIPGIAAVEGWSSASANLVLEGGKEGASVQILAPPVESPLLEPIMLKGRWLQPGDQNALVLSEQFLSEFPDLQPGDTIRLEIGDTENDWVVTGFFQFAGSTSGLIAYATDDYLNQQIGLTGRSGYYRIVGAGDGLTIEQQQALAEQVEAHLAGLGYEINEITTGLSLQETTSEGLNVLTTFLLIMSFLLAAVGSIGLAGTMSLNVMERTQEIGVMRAIGGSNRAITSIVLVEGMLIGLISWLLACLIAIPISKQLADIMFQIIFERDAALVLTPYGNLIWLGVVLLLAVLASVVPAYNATRLTIREVLAYE